jgi:hypothetical protein
MFYLTPIYYEKMNQFLDFIEEGNLQNIQDYYSSNLNIKIFAHHKGI